MTGRGLRVPMVLAVHMVQGGFSVDVEWEGTCGILGLFGPSGAGKTTVLEVVAGLRRASRALVEVGRRTLADTANGIDVPVRHRRVGYVPQDSLLFPHLRARANMLYGADRGSPAPLAEVAEMLEIAPLLDRPVTGLSGGERQRVALARALLSAPDLLLLDEPLAAVDVPRRRRILATLPSWLEARGIPALHVSHDAAEIAAVADHVIVLEDGRVVASGDAAILERGEVPRLS